MDRKKEKQKLENELKELKKRVEELEHLNDDGGQQLTIANEVFTVLGEFPLGRSLLNRAINRSKLRYLKQIVIPRREKALLKMAMDDSIPDTIKQQFSKDNIDLIIKARRAVKHRETFEEKSKHRVRSAFSKLQNFLDKTKFNRNHNHLIHKGD